MYFLEHKHNYSMPNILGNHSFPVKTWKWKQVAVCEQREPLEKLIPKDKWKEYRVISNNPNEDKERKDQT